MSLSRRTLLQTSAAAATFSLVGCKPKTVTPSAPSTEALLGQATDLILNAYPESASSAGLDGAKAGGSQMTTSNRAPSSPSAVNVSKASP